MFQPVKSLLELNEWDVYSEVQQAYGGYSRADIVATKNNLLIVIELKNSLSLAVIEQAYDWIGSADYVFVGVPKVKRGNRSDFSKIILKDYGIGLLEIDIQKYERWEKEPSQSTNEEVSLLKKLSHFYNHKQMGIDITLAKSHVIIKKDTFSNLFEEHKKWLPGGSATSKGKYVTPYALLMKDVYHYLRKELESNESEGWVSSNDIWNYLKENSKSIVVNHYKNPKQSIGLALRKYEDSEIENILIGNKNYYRIIQESKKYIFE